MATKRAVLDDSENWDWVHGLCNSHLEMKIPCTQCLEDSLMDEILVAHIVVDGLQKKAFFVRKSGITGNS